MTTIITDAFSQQNNDLVKATQASYLVSLNITKCEKLHTIGEELVKPSCVKIHHCYVVSKLQTKSRAFLCQPKL